MASETTRPLLATRLNAEPPIFRGCTSSELLVIVAVAVGVWLPVGFLVGAALGATTMGLGFSVLGALGTVLGASSLLERVKRGRPEGYYQQRVVLWLEDRGLVRRRHIHYSGPWDLGRRRER
jgi:conjugative transfer region protein (TIGR03750 family)